MFTKDLKSERDFHFVRKFKLPIYTQNNAILYFKVLLHIRSFFLGRVWNRFTICNVYYIFENYDKAQSACIVIEILWIKLKNDLIPNSLNLSAHVSKMGFRRHLHEY